MKVKVYWYEMDNPRLEAVREYDGVENYMIDEAGYLRLYDESDSIIPTIESTIAVYAAGEWHHFEQVDESE